MRLGCPSILTTGVSSGNLDVCVVFLIQFSQRGFELSVCGFVLHLLVGIVALLGVVFNSPRLILSRGRLVMFIFFQLCKFGSLECVCAGLHFQLSWRPSLKVTLKSNTLLVLDLHIAYISSLQSSLISKLKIPKLPYLQLYKVAKVAIDKTDTNIVITI